MLADALAEVEGASRFSSVIELARQRTGAKTLHSVINNPINGVDELREAIRDQWWVFGGRYLPPVSLHDIPILEEVDLALIRSDGAIHVVALGPANVPDLIIRADDGFRVGPLVEEIVHRTMNHLLAIETQEQLIRNVLGVETRRALGTVVIGSPAYAHERARDAVRNTIRTYSRRLVGLEIMTYRELMDSVDRTLELFENGEIDPRTGP
jgi:hypothetical protein